MHAKDSASSPLVAGQAVNADSAELEAKVTADSAELEAKVTALRRAATLLLIFGVVTWYLLSGWLAIAAAVGILCASPTKLPCRARCAKWLCVSVAFLASIAVVIYLGMLGKDYPQRFGAAVETRCESMPAATYLWAKSTLHDLHGVHHHHEENAAVSEGRGSRMLEKVYALVLSPTIYLETPQEQTMGENLERVKNEQEQACRMVAHCAHRLGSMLLHLATAANFFKLVAALAVARRARRLDNYLKRTAMCKVAVVAAPVVVVKPAPA